MGLGLQWIPEEDQEVDPAFGDRRADLLVATDRSAEEPLDREPELVGQ